MFVPNTATNIGSYAFANCISLTDFVFEDVADGGVPYTIGTHLFDGCAALAEMVLPNSMTNVIDREGYMVCPNGKRFHFLKTAPIKGNQFGRTEEYYQCEDCTGCPHREKCHKSKEDRVVRINEELTQFHKEVLNNLSSVHGALLRMNRSIQAEGAFGGIKWNKGYKRLRRRGIEGVILELGLISCGFNLYKYHLKKLAMQKAA